jgi:hypothetical protein
MKKFILLALILIFSTQIHSQNKAPYKAPKMKVWVLGLLNYDQTENKVPSSEFKIFVARLTFSGNFNNGIGYHVMGDFYDRGNLRATLMQAWFSYKITDYAQLRMGQFKYPFGSEAYGPLVKWKFINPSFVTLKIVKTLGMEGRIFRDIGIQLSGDTKINKSFAFVYKAMIMNGNGANVLENNNSKDIVLHAGIKVPYNVIISGAFYKGTSGIASETTNEVDENGITLTAQVNNKKYSAKFEYISLTKKLPTKDLTSAGYFAYATYKVTPHIEFGARYDNFDANTDVEEDLLNRTTIMAAYNFGGLNRIMLNYELRNNEKNDKWGNLLTVLFQAAL